MKIRRDYLDVSTHIVLQFAVEEINDTIEENGLIPPHPVFGVIQSFTLVSTDMLKQQKNEYDRSFSTSIQCQNCRKKNTDRNNHRYSSRS